jgi:hypothetical protein
MARPKGFELLPPAPCRTGARGRRMFFIHLPYSQISISIPISTTWAAGVLK